VVARVRPQEQQKIGENKRNEKRRDEVEKLKNKKPETEEQVGPARACQYSGSSPTSQEVSRLDNSANSQRCDFWSMACDLSKKHADQTLRPQQHGHMQ